MNCYFLWIKSFCISIVILIIFINTSSGQVGLKSPSYSIESGTDSTGIVFPKPVLPLRNWYDPQDHFFDLTHTHNTLEINQFISPNIIPKDPFKLDMRGSSYYVPRMVRDELNLMMNRPRESDVVPILPIAFLALQLASKYLLIQRKTEITAHDIENCQGGLPILTELWKNNPQTISELYKKKFLNDSYTMLELKRMIDNLMDNKLVKRKLIENSETQYFYAIDKEQYFHLIEQGKADKIDVQKDSIPQFLNK